MNVLVQHIPHAVPVVLIWGILLRYWLAQRRLSRVGAAAIPDAPAALAAAVPARRSPEVRRSVAVRGLVALGPLIGALATGLVIYALNLGGRHAGEAGIWAHVGLSLLALLLVGYKIADIGLARLRDSVGRARSWRTAGSLVLLVLWVPLVVSGVALLIAPSQASFTAYAHLIASVWWTGLLLWHLRRYLARAARTAFARPAARTDTVPGGPAGPSRRPAGPSPARTTARTRPIPERARGATGRLPPSGQGRPIGESEATGMTDAHGAAASARGRWLPEISDAPDGGPATRTSERR